MRIGIERLAPDDANRCQHAEPIGVGEVGPLAVHEQLELAEGAAVVGSFQIRNLATLGGNLANAAPSQEVPSG